MTEPPRPPGAGNSDSPSDPTAPLTPNTGGSPPPASPPPAYGTPPPPAYGSPQPPTYGSEGPAYGTPPPPSYGTPPGSGAGGYPPPGSGAGAYPPPGSGAGAYAPPGSGAGGYPPGGTQPPPYGYQQQAPGYPAAGYGTNDDKMWILVAHFGGAAGAFIGGGVGGWIAPLVALLVRGNQSPIVRAHAVAALNFQITWSIVAVICWALACIAIGFVLGPIAWLISIIFGVIAGAKASNGEAYRYPMSISLVK